MSTRAEVREPSHLPPPDAVIRGVGGIGLTTEKRALLESRLAYHHRCLREDAMDPTMTTLERLAIARDRVARLRAIERELDTAKLIEANREAEGAR